MKGILRLRGEPKHTLKHFQNSYYHCNLPLLYYSIYYYSIEHQDFRLQVDSRRFEELGQGKEVSKNFGISIFGFQVSDSS